MTDTKIAKKRTRKLPGAEVMARRKLLVDTFPNTGKVRRKQFSAFLGIGESTFSKYVKDGRISKPTKYGERVSVWDAEYAWYLKNNGIPEASVKGVM